MTFRDAWGRCGGRKSPNSEPTSGVTHFGDFAFAILSLRMDIFFVRNGDVIMCLPKHLGVLYYWVSGERPVVLQFHE